MFGIVWQSFGRASRRWFAVGSGAFEREVLLKEGHRHFVTATVTRKYSYKGYGISISV